MPSGPVPGPLGRSPLTRSAKKEIARAPGTAKQREGKRGGPPAGPGSRYASYLVDPASSHMLVSKIKPCMCKFTLINSKTADGSLQQY